MVDAKKSEIETLPWIRYDQNPYRIPLLDLRPITFQLGSDLDDISLKNLDSYSLEDGASFSGLSPEPLTDSIRIVECNLQYKTAGKLYPGSLFVPQTPEDRWAIFFDGAYLYFVRSWSKKLVAKAAVVQQENALIITQIEGNLLDDAIETDNQTIALANFLILSHVLNETAPVPLLNELEFDPNRAAVWAFSLFGHRAKVGVFDENALFPSNNVIRSITAYHIAIANNDLETVRLILSQQLVDKDLIAQDGFTPIHWALYTDHFEMLELLVEKGVAINALSLGGTTPLMDAVELKTEKGIATLIKLGADLNIADFSGYTALHRAAAMGDLLIAKTLLMGGADAEIRSHQGALALDLAKAKGHQAIVDLLSTKA